MKKDIHPKMHSIKVNCSCGHEFDTLSVLKELHVDICSACHPFFTGKTKLVDTAGRVERFQNRLAKKVEAPNAKQPRVVTIS